MDKVAKAQRRVIRRFVKWKNRNNRRDLARALLWIRRQKPLEF